MKCQNLFSGKKNKKNVDLSSAELALRVVKIKHSLKQIIRGVLICLNNLFIFLIYFFSSKYTLLVLSGIA